MVLINMDSSYISMEPMKNRHSAQIIATHQIILDRLKACGINPKHHTLDNECSEEFKEATRVNKMTYQLVPADDHGRNIAKRAIQTGKSHIISVLYGCNPNFPLHLWHLLIPQMEMQLNLQRQLRTIDKVSAYAHHYGPYDFNAHSLAPLGAAIEHHASPAMQASFGMHSLLGWYIGVSLEHYRCHKSWITETRGVRVGNTVFFKHKYLTMPTITTADAILTAARDLQDALDGVFPQSHYDKGIVEKFIEILNAKAKTYQIDKILEHRAHTDS